MLPDALLPWGFLVASLAGFGLGLFVYLRDPQGPVHRCWLHFSLAASIWALGMFGVIQLTSGLWVLGLARAAHAAYALVPLFFMRFVLALSGETHQPRWLRWADRSAALFAILSFTPLVVSDLQTGTPFAFYPSPGPFYGPFAIWFCLLFGGGLAILMAQ